MTTTTRRRPRLVRTLLTAALALGLLAGSSTAVADYDDDIARYDRQLREQREERERLAREREQVESRLEGTNADLAAAYLALEDANAPARSPWRLRASALALGGSTALTVMSSHSGTVRPTRPPRSRAATSRRRRARPSATGTPTRMSCSGAKRRTREALTCDPSTRPMPLT